MKQLDKSGKTHTDGFEFKKLLHLDKDNGAARRATLSYDEQKVLKLAIRTNTAKHNKLDDVELRV